MDSGADMVGHIFTRIELPRLVLRHFGDSDLSIFHAYRNDPEIARYQGWESLNEDQARAFIEAVKAEQPGVPSEWFQFATELKETRLLIGDCALKVDQEEPRQAQIGYTFAREHQGKGYASEAVTALLDYAFNTLSLHRVYAFVNCDNHRSVALLERLNMRREGHFIQNYWHKNGWVDEYQYAVLESEWLNRERQV